MTHLNRRLLLTGSAAFTAASLSGCAITEALAPKTSVVTPSGEGYNLKAAEKLNVTFENIFNELVANSPGLATSLGLDKGELSGLKSKLDLATPKERIRVKTFYQTSIAAIKTVPRDQLSGMDQINYDTVLWDYSQTLDGMTRFDFGAPGYPAPYMVTQLTGAYLNIPDFLDTQHSIETKADSEAYLSRLSDYAGLLDQETERLKADVAKGVIAPDFAIDKAIIQLKGQRDTKSSESVLVQSLAMRTKALGIAGDWTKAATATFEGPIISALDRQIATLQAIRPKATHEAGVWDIPKGEDYYKWAAKYNTSTNLTPDEIHNIGLEKVKEINAELEVVLVGLGMTKGTPGERMAAMTKDPRYIYDNTDAGKDKLLAELNKQIEVIYAKLPAYFGVLPKSKVDVRRIPKASELGAPGGYYQPPSLDGARPGAYYINLRDTAEVPSWSLPTLTYHEAIPGHHMQISIQQETKGLPMLRKLSGFTAYVEGWALYSEQLADEMGMYDMDKAGKVGYLHDAMFRAVRLVVDTGMHSKRWSREKAIAYMVEQTGDPETGVATEIERYCVWPGQALGYMIGKIKWLELRAKMKARLGAKFDIRAFHDTGLLAGAVPLAVLDSVYEDWAAKI
jgi:uncharacterized protein (DUF885 family)